MSLHFDCCGCCEPPCCPCSLVREEFEGLADIDRRAGAYADQGKADVLRKETAAARTRIRAELMMWEAAP